MDCFCIEIIYKINDLENDIYYFGITFIFIVFVLRKLWIKHIMFFSTKYKHIQLVCVEIVCIQMTTLSSRRINILCTMFKIRIKTTLLTLCEGLQFITFGQHLLDSSFHKGDRSIDALYN